LAQNISQIKGVQQARVTISRPEPSPFLLDAQPTRANVMLDLQRGYNFGQEQAASIVMMMAHSVEGLDPERVSVVDTAGNQLSSMRSPADTLLSDQYRYSRQLESDLSARAEWLLASYLGPGNVLVRVTADVDFRESSMESLTYDPEARAKRSERIFSRTGTQMRHRELGPAGTASNVGSTAFSAGGQPVSDREQMEETEYENARILETVREAPAIIRRLTIAAVVDLGEAAEDTTMAQAGVAGLGGAASGAEPTAPRVSKEDIERILKQAVGFDDARGDQIAVVVGRLAGSSLLALPPSSTAPPWEWYRELLRNASLGIASIVALILGFLLVGRMRPLAMPTSTGGAAQADRARRIAALSAHAMQDPDSLAKILQVWLGNSGQADASQVNSASAERDSAPQEEKRPGKMAA
jgi:flagellar M-ring protein FliF